LRYQSAQVHSSHYFAAAGIDATLHQLRHTHATELVNAGVSLATIRKQLGHRNLRTTLRYAKQSDATADAELRVWRRRKGRHALLETRRRGLTPTMPASAGCTILIGVERSSSEGRASFL
jgi:hypothetical protein